jgi:FMN phosphatase YigB (HAD superfamily)
MEIILSFTAIIVFFALCFGMYEIWFHRQQAKQDKKNNENANFDYSKYHEMNEDIFGDLRN